MRSIRSSLVLVLLSAPSAALAARPAADGTSDPTLIFASGRPAAPVRPRSDAPPTEASRTAWARFFDATGQTWRAQFDAETGVPSRVWGGKLEVPGATISPAIAEAAARDLFLRHADLFAPGLKAEDLVLAADDLSNGLRTVAFFQRHQGLEVEGGQLSVRFKKDRLFVVASQAWPNLRSEAPLHVVAERDAAERARTYVHQVYGAWGTVERVRGPFVLPLPAAELERPSLDDRVALEVKVRTAKPAGLWSVYLDAATGEPIAHRQRLMFASGTVQLDAPERWPGGTRRPYPASHLTARIDGATVSADADGLISWSGAQTATVAFGAVGTLVRVVPQTGTATATRVHLAPGGAYTWSAAATERDDAQLVTYVASETVKARAAIIAPRLSWLTTSQLVANVNINDICNAFSDGETTNFFLAGGAGGVRCENTGRIPDVIYHEFGHAFHFHAITPGVGVFDTPFSEGASDYLAATITGDEGMGRGFFFDDSPLRELDPPNEEASWPDSIANDPHETGLIFAGAMWDLRKGLVAELGEQAGVALADQLFYAALQRASDIPSTYVEILAADDDDGDLSNGTPHVCLIDDAFSPHGIADPNLSGPGLGVPAVDGREVTLVAHRENSCPGTQVGSIVLDWKIRGEPSSAGQVNLGLSNGTWAAHIPVERDGVVVQYKVTVTLANGTVTEYPNNPADPFYELYLGPTEMIYCTDFEWDPIGDGWSHELLAGDGTLSADDWELGTPNQATASGDPGAAHSGSVVFGNDLGIHGNPPDGRYTPNTTNILRSPTFDFTGYAHVRLQYWRWLTVEDGAKDQAKILVNDQLAWTNLATVDGTTHHIDREWRFQDVDLTPYAADGSTVQVGFEIVTNRRRRFGGWNVDDFCVVGIAAVCGNGEREAGEACDDGNTTAGDGCEADCTVTPPAVCGNAELEAGEACDDGNTTAGDGCEADCTITRNYCGNAVVEAGEACDDGKNDGTACTATCQLPLTTLATEDGGCGCATTRAPDARSHGATAFALFALGLTFALRRRR